MSIKHFFRLAASALRGLFAVRAFDEIFAGEGVKMLPVSHGVVHRSLAVKLL
jgi:hypothetical protein